MSRPEWLGQLVPDVEHGPFPKHGKVTVVSVQRHRNPQMHEVEALVEAADIVLALADDQVDPIGHGGVCCLCEEQWDPPENTWEHADSCPWLRSRLWIESHGQ